jgi:asparagine synthase (glutamine-hydrolysing)
MAKRKRADWRIRSVAGGPAGIYSGPVSVQGGVMKGLCGWFDKNGGARTPKPAVPDAALLDAMLGAAGMAGKGACVVATGHLQAIVFGGEGAGGAEPMLTHGDGTLAVALSEPVVLAGRTVGAAEVAAAWRADPENLPGCLQGSFALAAADPERALLAVDRAGIRGLYWLEHRGRLWFSSRLAALTAVPGLEPAIDEQALFDYLYFQMVPSPGCIYRGVRKLLPGQCLIRHRARRAPRFYWHMPYRDDNPAGLKALAEAFHDLLPRVVGAAAAGADPRTLGCFLSGGTDSSTVAGTLRGLAGEVTTYSMGFAAEGYDELAFARIAARHFQTRAREYTVTADDVVDCLPRLAAHCDEPFGNASIVPAHLCARFAHGEGIRRMLGGDGGDELFGGNQRYANHWVFELYGRMPALGQALLERTLGLPGVARVPLLRKAQSYVAQAKVPLPERLETYFFLHGTATAEIYTAELLEAVDPEAPLANLREVYRRTDSAAAINRMMHLDLKITLADNDLRKVNQACELAGIDVRYPLLDDRMMTFAASVPPAMQLKRTRLRWFFKRALADFLPPQIIAKRKQGFGLPVGLWMTTHQPLRELVEDSLGTLARRNIVRPSYIHWVRQQQRETHASYYGVMLWLLVMLEQWLGQHPGGR